MRDAVADDLQILFALLFALFAALFTGKRFKEGKPRGQDLVLLCSCAYFSGSTMFGAAKGQLPQAAAIDVAMVWASFFLYGAALLVVPMLVRSKVTMPMFGSLFLAARAVPLSRAWPAFFMLVALRAMLATAGGLFYDGSSAEGRPFWVQMASGFAGTLSVGLMARAFTSWDRLFTPTMFASEFTIASMAGRRQSIEVAVFVLLAYLLSDPKRLNLKLVGKLAAAAAVFYWLLSPLFLAVRYEYGQQDTKGRNNFIAIAMVLPDAIERIPEFMSVSSDNLARRMAVHDFNFAIASHQTEPMWGQAFWLNAVWSVPSALYRNKTSGLMPEASIQVHHGLAIFDEGSNWPLVGYADFGVLGGFVAGAIFSLLIDATLLWSCFLLRRGNQLSSAMFVGVVLHVALYVDTDPLEFFLSLRDAAILTVPAIMFTGERR